MTVDPKNQAPQARSPASPSISVIMPVYNASAFLGRSLPPLAMALKEGKIAELIAVDDGSSDNSAQLAAQLGARVIPSGGRLGPGGARNVAAQLAKGDILWFVDSDVVVSENGAERIRGALSSPDVWAVFGSYDDAPAARNFGSQYKNLLHHHHHQHGNPDAATFWAGCGAVRRARFLELGGFDAAKFVRPSIEDIELGYRIKERGGRIALDRGCLSKHLKRWSVAELVRVDIFQRAFPWARLMLGRGSVTNDLNVSLTERLRAVLAGLLALSLITSAAGVTPLWSPLALVAFAIAANARLFQTFARARGPFFALMALLFHQLYYLYSTAVFAWCWLERRLSPRSQP
jgi:glycosyltransferase involved in cell wall biosynthesis